MASRNDRFLRAGKPQRADRSAPHQAFEKPRIHNGLTSSPEKRVADLDGERTPRWINSDHLTVLGFVAQVMAGASYALARWNRYWLLAVIFSWRSTGWATASTARWPGCGSSCVRATASTWTTSSTASAGWRSWAGLALSGYMHPYIAIGLLIAFLLLSIQSYLATYTLGEFQLSFWNFGPTELRILLAAATWRCCITPWSFTDSTDCSTSAARLD